MSENAIFLFEKKNQMNTLEPRVAQNSVFCINSSICSVSNIAV